MSVGVLFYLTFREKLPSILQNKLESISLNFLDFGVGELYYYNSNWLNPEKLDFSLSFSNKDLMYLDSVKTIINTEDLIIIPEKLKEWRNFEIFFNNELIKGKFKLHGASTAPYKLGYSSLTVKSKKEINGFTDLKLITGNEMDYKNIFLNYFAKKHDLISEDTGEIILTNMNGRTEVFFMYQVFDEKYLKTKFDMKDPKIFRRKTFIDHPSQWHSSSIDDVPINLDQKMIKQLDLDYWAKFIKDKSSKFYDEMYMGRFMALIQLFGHPHQITGNNDKWILNETKFYPVYRNEGIIEKITYDELDESSVFDKYYESSTHKIYENSLLNWDVYFSRNQTFKKIIDNKNEIISGFDSIYNSNKEKLMFNPRFLATKLKHKTYIDRLKHNIGIIESYLNMGFVILAYDGKNLRVVSSRKNPIKIKTSKSETIVYPFGFQNIKNSKSEVIIDDTEDIQKLEIYDLVLDKKLTYEESYSIIYIN